MSVYATSPVKCHRRRRTDSELQTLLDAVREIIAEEGRMTIRHMFYVLASGRHLIEKAEADYKNLCRHLANWRRSGAVAWDAFTDNTRWHIKPRTFDGVEDALNNAVENYRRNLWETQPYYVEAWVEKDAIAGIVAEAARDFGVPVFVARGFASLSSLYDAANTFRDAIERGKRPVIYHLGDYDPSGVAAGTAMLRTFKEDFGIHLEFIRLAVTSEQIEWMDLPTRPVKTTDRRAKTWGDDRCVELDTMPPAQIRRLVEDAIAQHIDRHAWEVMQATEAMERQTLKATRRETLAGIQRRTGR